MWWKSSLSSDSESPDNLGGDYDNFASYYRPTKRPCVLDPKETLAFHKKADGTIDYSKWTEEFEDFWFYAQGEQKNTTSNNVSNVSNASNQTKYAHLALAHYKEKEGVVYEFTKLRRNAPLKLPEPAEGSHMNFYARREGDVFQTIFYAEIGHCPKEEVLCSCPLDLRSASDHVLNQLIIHPPGVKCELCTNFNKGGDSSSYPGWDFGYSSEDFDD